MIGEFHFGALDRGIFHTGLKKASNQKHRAELFNEYLKGAARNPLIVGAHWFQYVDHVTSARIDGENYQIGFLSITDTPHQETIDASRAFADELYNYRLDN